MPQKQKSKLDIAIDDVLSEMAHHSPTTEEYAKLLERLKDLTKLKEQPYRPNPDVVLQSVVYILGIGMIIRHEQFNIITTKALGFMPRVR